MKLIKYIGSKNLESFSLSRTYVRDVRKFVCYQQQVKIPITTSHSIVNSANRMKNRSVETSKVYGVKVDIDHNIMRLFLNLEMLKNTLA